MSQDRFFNSLSADFGDSGAGFTEEELLAYVEGELTPDRMDSLTLRLLTDPVLFRQLEQMRINRSLLMSMPLERAPAELLSRVQIAFEQQALVGSPLEEDLSPQLKLVSDGTPIGGMRRMEIAQNPWYQSRVAMAAGVLLLISGGLYWGATAFLNNFAKPIGPIAILPRETAVPLPESTASPKIEIASAPGNSDESPTEISLVEEDPQLRLVDAGAPTQSDLASAISLPDRIISADQAAALAKDGRLAIRVATLRSEQAVAQVDKLSAVRPEASRSWRIGRDISAEVVDTIASATAEPSQPMARSKENHDQAIASGSIHAAAKFAQSFHRIQMPFSSPSFQMTESTIPRKPTGFVVEVDAASTSLAAIKGLLAEKTDSVATFIELPTAIDAGPLTDPETILWFTQSPENWVPRVRVPVVVGR